MNNSFDTGRYNRENDEAPSRPSNWPAERIVKPTPEGWVNPCDGAGKCRRGWMGGCGPGCLTAERLRSARAVLNRAEQEASMVAALKDPEVQA